MNRRKFIKIMGAAGAAAIIPWRFDLKNGWQAGAAYAAINSVGLKLWNTTFRLPTILGGEIPVAHTDGTRVWTGPPMVTATHYTINLGQFTDSIGGGGPTTLWGYNPTQAQGVGGAIIANPTQRHLGGIIIAVKNTPVQITFQNGLPTQNIIPVDTSILGANQAMNRAAVHLHGGYVPWISDGGPFDWFTPSTVQGTISTHGSSFLNNTVLNPGASPGQAEYYYPNQQSDRLMWYHDHAWGITRTNAYAGLATGYVLVDGFETPVGATAFNTYGAPVVGGTRYIPLVLQDKIFIGANFNNAAVAGAQIDPFWPAGLPTTAGSLWYAHTYDPKIYKLNLRGKNKPFLPDPSVVPEFFGDTMLANGTVYPQHNVDPGLYRFQVLNACNARFVNLQLYVQDASLDGITLNTKTLAPTNQGGPPFTLLGTEGGFLPSALTIPSNVPFSLVTLTGSLILAPAERADFILDFSAFKGKTLILYTDAPAPFPVGSPLFDYLPNTLGTGPNTREIMRFIVSNNTVTDPTLSLPATLPGNDPLLVPAGQTVTGTGANATIVTPASATNTRYLTLNETFDASGRLLQLIGTNVPLVAGTFGRGYMDPATEVIQAGTTEVWKITNLTGDTHPIHFHLVNVQILARQPVKVNQYTGVNPLTYLGPPVMPAPDEQGWKETVRMNPGDETTVAMTFTLPTVPFTVPTSPRQGAAVSGTDPGSSGLQVTFPAGTSVAHEYVCHCHILEHEEHDMMRPLVVLT